MLYIPRRAGRWQLEHQNLTIPTGLKMIARKYEHVAPSNHPRNLHRAPSDALPAQSRWRVPEVCKYSAVLTLRARDAKKTDELLMDSSSMSPNDA